MLVLSTGSMQPPKGESVGWLANPTQQLPHTTLLKQPHALWSHNIHLQAPRSLAKPLPTVASSPGLPTMSMCGRSVTARCVHQHESSLKVV